MRTIIASTKNLLFLLLTSFDVTSQKKSTWHGKEFTPLNTKKIRIKSSACSLSLRNKFINQYKN